MVNRKHHPAFILPLSLSVIFGSFTLGFYVAIQGPTLMDLIDLLHVNNDIMSHSLSVASLAYSVGGLLSGLIFNYVDRQMLIPALYVIFGVSNILTPYITNYYVFSVVTVFKMMCAGGTDCGANVWILDMWPGKDAWLQALHFSFAIGCALGPLVVEPFLSASEHKEPNLESLEFKAGNAVINNESNETRIYVPYAVSGSANLLAAFAIILLYVLEARRKRRDAALMGAHGDDPLAACPLSGGGKLHASGSPEAILMSAVQHPAAIEAGLGGGGGSRAASPSSQVALSVPDTIPEEEASVPLKAANSITPPDSPRASPRPPATPLAPATRPQATQSTPSHAQAQAQQQQQQIQQQNHTNNQQQQQQQVQLLENYQTAAAAAEAPVKFTSKAKEGDGRPPYYVMLAITLSALCLSFYCGIEIVSMNYLATFAVNIDLQLPKSSAALMSSALTISFAVGRLIGIWLAAIMRPHMLFYLCSFVMALGNVFILIFANTAEMLLWASVCLFGIGCGPMYASIVSFYDDKISKVTNTVSGIFILGSMFNVALNTLIIGHYIIDNALILIVCNLIGAVLLLCLFGSLHALTRIKKNQRKKKFKLQQLKAVTKPGAEATNDATGAAAAAAAAAGDSAKAIEAAAVAVEATVASASGLGANGGAGVGVGGISEVNAQKDKQQEPRHDELNE